MNIPESPTAALMAELIYLRGEIKHFDDLIQRYGDFLQAQGLFTTYGDFCRENPIASDFDR
jgi:hypothetical protein